MLCWRGRRAAPQSARPRGSRHVRSQQCAFTAAAAETRQLASHHSHLQCALPSRVDGRLVPRGLAVLSLVIGLVERCTQPLCAITYTADWHGRANTRVAGPRLRRAPGNTACMRRALPLTATGARAHHRKHGMHTRVPGSMACTQNIAMGNTKSGECWRAVGNQATKVGQQCEERGTSALARRARCWRLAPWSAHLVSEQLDLTKTTSSNRGAALFVVDETAGSSKRGIAL